MFAKFDEIPAMALQDMKDAKRYGWTMWKQYTLHKKVCMGCNKYFQEQKHVKQMGSRSGPTFCRS